MLRWFFTAVYFYIFFKLIALIFRRVGAGPGVNLLILILWFVAFIASLILADVTVKKIEEKDSEK